jgi:hypothetical protein
MEFIENEDKNLKVETLDRNPIENYIPTNTYRFNTRHIKSMIIKHPQCHMLNDKYYLVDFDSYCYNIRHPNKTCKNFPIIINLNELDEGGIYVYVLLSFNDNEPIMYLIKTYTVYEFGTKHQQLIYRITCDNRGCKNYNLYYAGELQKKDNKIIFNFYSGTFMKDKLNPETLTNDIEFMRNHISLLLFNPDIDIIFTDEPIITNENIIFTYDDLDQLKTLGAIVYEFDNKEDCKNHIKRTKVIAETPRIAKPNKQILKTNTSRLYGGKMKKTKKRRKIKHSKMKKPRNKSKSYKINKIK